MYVFMYVNENIYIKMYIFRNTKKKHFTNHGSAANSVSTFLQNTGAKNIIL